jgi:hypothetical protein
LLVHSCLLVYQIQLAATRLCSYITLASVEPTFLTLDPKGLAPAIFKARSLHYPPGG